MPRYPHPHKPTLVTVVCRTNIQFEMVALAVSFTNTPMFFVEPLLVFFIVFGMTLVLGRQNAEECPDILFLVSLIARSLASETTLASYIQLRIISISFGLVTALFQRSLERFCCAS